MDEPRIVAAIGEAEKRTSGEIRVFISSQETVHALKDAQTQFLRLGMQKTRERNGVLLFVAPRSRAFAVVGDEAVHARCGDGLWQEVAAAMEGHFKANRFTDALLLAVERLGGLLARHFPRRADDENELRDELERG